MRRLSTAIDTPMQTMTSNQRTPQPASAAALAPASANGAARARLTTEELFAGAREIVLVHNGREYRLRITQQGKLLLTA
jgi:hemin uptake protein HemP